MEKLKIKFEKPENLIPYVNNHKIHSDEQILRLCSSIQEFGFDQPIVVDKNNIIIKGHGRREAALKLKMKEVPVVVADHLNEFQVKAARIADNKTSSLEYNKDLLAFDIKSLELKDFNLSSLGIRTDELNDLLKEIDIGIPDLEFIKVQDKNQINSLHKKSEGLELKEESMPIKHIENTSSEININEFDNFDHECPKCGFEWNDSNKEKNEAN